MRPPFRQLDLGRAYCCFSRMQRRTDGGSTPQLWGIPHQTTLKHATTIHPPQLGLGGAYCCFSRIQRGSDGHPTPQLWNSHTSRGVSRTNFGDSTPAMGIPHLLREFHTSSADFAPALGIPHQPWEFHTRPSETMLLLELVRQAKRNA